MFFESQNSQGQSAEMPRGRWILTILTVCLALIALAYNGCGNDVEFADSIESLSSTLPNPEIVIESGAQSTNRSTLKLDINVYDHPEMKISADTDCSSGNFEPSSALKEIPVARENQVINLSLQYKTADGVLSPCETTQILHDNFSPEIRFSKAQNLFIGVPDFSLGFSGIDDSSGVAEILCGVDTQSLAPCATGIDLADLTEGAQSIFFQVKDRAGNTTDAVYHLNVDLTDPSILINAGPPLTTNLASADFVFTATDLGSGIEKTQCQTGAAGSAWVDCVPPFNIPLLAQGNQRFAVRAIDKVGRASADLVYNWVIDQAVPSVQILTNPNPVDNQSSATFTFSGSDNGVVLNDFECRVDANVFAACLASTTLNGLLQGPHRFEVRSRDAAGNNSAVAAFNWNVDLTDPTVTIISGPPSISLPDVSLSFTAADVGSAVARTECQLNGSGFADCVSPVSFNGLDEGAYVFEVRAVDMGGNVSATQSHNWTVRGAESVLGRTLNLNLTDCSSLPPEVTLSRSSVASFINNQGLVEVAGANQARCDHDAITGEPLGLLIESGATNLVLRSGDLSNSGVWNSTGNASVTSGFSAPDGSSTAAKLTESSTSAGFHTVSQEFSKATTPIQYTMSVFAKRGERQGLQFGLQRRIAPGDFDGALCNVNLQDFTVISTGQYGFTLQKCSIEVLRDGWARASVTITTDSGNNAQAHLTTLIGTGGNGNYSGTVGNGIFLWGVQVEAGAFMSSYIPTTNAQVNRVAETANVVNLSWLGTGAGTFLMQWSPALQQGTPVDVPGFSLENNGTTNSIGIHLSSSNLRTNFAMTNNSVAEGAGVGQTDWSAGDVRWSAMTYESNDMGSFEDGVKVDQDGAVSIPNNFSRLSFGSTAAGYHESRVRQLMYWPEKRLDADGVALTANTTPVVQEEACAANVNSGQAYSCQPTVVDGDEVDIHFWSLAPGTTCTWANIDSTTGAVSGTAVGANCTLNLQVSDGINQSAVVSHSISVN